MEFWKCDERKVQPTLPNQKSVKFLQNQFLTFALSFFHLLTVPSPSSCSLFFHERHPRQGSHPTGEALCTSTTGRLSHTPLSHSSSHKTQLTTSHPAPLPPALASCAGLKENKILAGWKQSSGQGLVGHDSSSTQLVLPYSSQRFGTNCRPRRRSADSLRAIFYIRPNQRRPKIVFLSVLLLFNTLAQSS